MLTVLARRVSILALVCAVSARIAHADGPSPTGDDGVEPPAPTPAQPRVGGPRSFGLAISVAPFSALIEIGDARGRPVYQPVLAQLGIDLDWQIELASFLSLEITGRTSVGVASSALERFDLVMSDGEVGFRSASILSGRLGAGLGLVTDWVGLGLVRDERWDATWATAPGERARSRVDHAGAFGGRLLVGLGLRDPSLRLVLEGTVFTRAARSGLAYRAVLRGDIGVVMLCLSTESLFLTGARDAPLPLRVHAATLGFQAAF